MLLIIFFFLAIVAIPGNGKEKYIDKRISLKFVSSHKEFSPGDTILFAIEAKMSKGWHIYWINPGDAGEPTQFFVKTNVPGTDLILPSFPIPNISNTNGVVSFEYLGRVYFPFKVVVPNNFSEHFLEVSAKASWLVCKERCVPGKADLIIKIPRGKISRTTKNTQTIIENAFAQIPKNENLNIIISKEKFYYKISFPLPKNLRPKSLFIYPISEGIFDLEAKQNYIISNDTCTVELKVAQYIWGDTTKLQGIIEIKTIDNKKKYFQFDVQQN